MRQLELTRQARADLARILGHIAEQSGSVAVARRFGGELRARCEELAGHDFVMGRPRSELRAGLRSIAHKGYVLLFDYPDDSTMRLMRVVNGRRDLPALFRADER